MRKAVTRLALCIWNAVNLLFLYMNNGTLLPSYYYIKDYYPANIMYMECSYSVTDVYEDYCYPVTAGTAVQEYIEYCSPVNCGMLFPC